MLGALAGVEVAVASPEGYALRRAGASSSDDPREAVAGAHVVYADVWVSMGDKARPRAPRGSRALPDRRRAARQRGARRHRAALPPAHPGEEITAQVLYGTRQRIWDQAENRRHAQKALLELLVE